MEELTVEGVPVGQLLCGRGGADVVMQLDIFGEVMRDDFGGKHSVCKVSIDGLLGPREGDFVHPVIDEGELVLVERRSVHENRINYNGNPSDDPRNIYLRGCAGYGMAGGCLS